MIETWWAQVEPGAQFVRTPLSGGWGNPQLRGEFKASGDLMTKANRWPFCVEVKRREAWTWERLRAGKRSPVLKWWRQAVKQAEEMGAIPMLWFRRNREPWYVMIPVEDDGKLLNLANELAAKFNTNNLFFLNMSPHVCVLPASVLLQMNPIEMALP